MREERIVCDRCKEVSEDGHEEWCVISDPVIYAKYNEARTLFDLCPECSKSFRKWWSKP